MECFRLPQATGCLSIDWLRCVTCVRQTPWRLCVCVLFSWRPWPWFVLARVRGTWRGPRRTSSWGVSSTSTASSRRILRRRTARCPFLSMPEVSGRPGHLVGPWFPLPTCPLCMYQLINYLNCRYHCQRRERPNHAVVEKSKGVDLEQTCQVKRGVNGGNHPCEPSGKEKGFRSLLLTKWGFSGTGPFHYWTLERGNVTRGFSWNSWLLVSARLMRGKSSFSFGWRGGGGLAPTVSPFGSVPPRDSEVRSLEVRTSGTASGYSLILTTTTTSTIIPTSWPWWMTARKPTTTR